MFALIRGDLTNGIEDVYGPYEDREEAERDGEHLGAPWVIVTMRSPLVTMAAYYGSSESPTSQKHSPAGE
jgi:hypothetical protein